MSEEINLVHMPLQVAARNHRSKVTCPTVFAGYGKADTVCRYVSQTWDYSYLFDF